jgi:hypothetical protein
MELGGVEMAKDSLTEEEKKEYLALINKINIEHPDKEDIEALRNMLIEHPNLWRVAGDLAYRSQCRLLCNTRITVIIREGVVAGLAAMRIELGYGDAPMLEQMLIQQLLLSWLRLNLWEDQLIGIQSQGMSLDKANFWDRRLSAAQKRYLRACETLARVRRLARLTPALQVNINTDSGQQVNIAGNFVKPSDEA